MGRVLTFGEALATFFVETDGVLSPASIGGAEVNTAVGVARLGHEVSWMSRLGDDAFAEAVRSLLRAEGIDDRFVRTEPGGKTGLIVKQRWSDEAVRSEHYRADSAASHLSPGDLAPGYLDDVDWVHASCITPSLGDGPRRMFETVLGEAAARGIRVSLDTNHRTQLIDDDGLRRIVGSVIGHVDTLFCNEDEARVLTGTDDPERALADLLGRGPRAVVVKLGLRGALAGDGTGIRHAPAVEIPSPHHPVGAGDAFAAGWIAGIRERRTVDETLRQAAWCAAQVVADPGDQAGFPRRARLSEVSS